jgi:hypothetical protein
MKGVPKMKTRIKPVKVIKANKAEHIDEAVQAVDPKITLLTPKETIERIFNNQVSYWKLLNMAKRNEIPHIRLGKRKILFCEKTLAEWVRNKQN